MKIVFKLANDKRAEAENLVKADDLINRQSITIRSAESLSLTGLENCYIMIIDGSEEAVEKAKELLKEKAEIITDAQNIIGKIADEEDKAACGFGSIFG